MIYYESQRANPSGGIYHQWDTNLGFASHLHDSFELIYVYKGSMEVTVDDTTYLLTARQAILVFPNQIHSLRTVGASSSYLCIFQNSLVGEFSRIAKSSSVETPVFFLHSSSVIEKLSSKNNSRYMLKSLLYEIIHCFNENCGKYTARKNKISELLGGILRFIHENYTNDIRLQDVAKEMGYDHHYLSNLIQKNLNTTFRNILNEYRISHAKYLLTSTTDSISSISHECGYDSLCSFNRNFKQLVNTTPSEYRKNG